MLNRAADAAVAAPARQEYYEDVLKELEQEIGSGVCRVVENVRMKIHQQR